MDEQTSTPGGDDAAQEGTFAGGGFGRDEDEEPTTAEPGPVADEESTFPSDVEGTSTEPTPGERNDPV